MNYRLIRSAKNLFVSFVVLGAVFFGQGGCSRPRFDGKPIEVSASSDRAYDACRYELERRGFKIDYENRRGGVIRTLPLVSSQWFEPWCQDVVTMRDVLESSLHTMRRTVELKVVCPDDGICTIACNAPLERLSAPSVFEAGAVRARDLFVDSSGRMPTLSASQKRDAREWVLLGRDSALKPAFWAV